MLEAVKVALDPSPAQIRSLNSHAGAARFAFNSGLAQVKQLLDQSRADESVEVPWNLYSLRRWWNAEKSNLAPWWAENSKEAYNSGLDALARGLQNFSTSKNGKRRGRRVGFPKFKSRNQSRKTFQYTTGSFGIADPYGVKLPRIGRIHTHERIDDRLAGATLKRVTVSESGGRWYASFTVERAEHPSEQHHEGPVVGVDLGVTKLATLSTGEVLENPKHLKSAQRKLRRLNKAYSRTERGSAGRRHAADRLAKAHARIRHLRVDTIHKMTTSLAKRFGTIVLEDLNVAGMVKNRHLSRSISDAAFGEIRRQLEYKTSRRDGNVVLADRWYPSSKTCSACRVVKAKLPLSARVFDCDACDLLIDRDVNAAINLRQLVAGSDPETLNGDGGPVRPEPVLARTSEVTTVQDQQQRAAGPQDADRQLVTVAS